MPYPSGHILRISTVPERSGKRKFRRPGCVGRYHPCGTSVLDAAINLLQADGVVYRIVLTYNFRSSSTQECDKYERHLGFFHGSLKCIMAVVVAMSLFLCPLQCRSRARVALQPQANDVYSRSDTNTSNTSASQSNSLAKFQVPPDTR